ncbi:unnamed protein product [Urochloa humidicola]
MTDQTTDRRSNSPLDDGEILLRVPPQPSTLPRVSLMCKRWRRIVSDPWFLCRFRGHHQTAPLLGFFKKRVCLLSPFDPQHDHGENDFVFKRTPGPHPFPAFLPGTRPHRHGPVVGCRHGRVLL